MGTFSTNDLAAGASVALKISSYPVYADTRPGNTDSQQWGITLDCALAEFQTNGYMYIAYHSRPRRVRTSSRIFPESLPCSLPTRKARSSIRDQRTILADARPSSPVASHQ